MIRDGLCTCSGFLLQSLQPSALPATVPTRFPSCVQLLDALHSPLDELLALNDLHIQRRCNRGSFGACRSCVQRIDFWACAICHSVESCFQFLHPDSRCHELRDWNTAGTRRGPFEFFEEIFGPRRSPPQGTLLFVTFGPRRHPKPPFFLTCGSRRCPPGDTLLSSDLYPRSPAGGTLLFFRVPIEKKPTCTLLFFRVPSEKKSSWRHFQRLEAHSGCPSFPTSWARRSQRAPS